MSRGPVMARAIAAALCALLSACSGGGAPPLPPPGPVPEPRPGVQTFAADFSGPSIGLGLTCTGDVPPDCSTLPAQYTYGTFHAPGDQGDDCVDPGPNHCYRAENGRLILSSIPGLSGFPIITRQTFTNTGIHSMRLVAAGTCLSQACWGGAVDYGGDAAAGTGNLATGEWRGIYFSYASPGMFHIGVWGPTLVYLLPGMTFPSGTVVDMEIQYWAGGTWVYKVTVNGVSHKWTEDAANPFMPDTRILSNRPNAAIFLGDLTMEVVSWDVYEAP